MMPMSNDSLWVNLLKMKLDLASNFSFIEMTKNQNQDSRGTVIVNLKKQNLKSLNDTQTCSQIKMVKAHWSQ